MIRKIIACAVLLFLSGGILSARSGYRMEQIHRFFNQADEKIGQAAKKTAESLSRAGAIFREIPPYVSGDTRKPYPDLRERMTKLDAFRDRMKSRHARTAAIHDDVMKSTKGRDALYTDDPDYAKIMGYRSELQKMAEDIRNDIPTAQKLMDELRDIANQHHIVPVRLTDLKKKIAHFDAELRKLTDDGKKNITQAKAELESPQAGSFSRDFIARQKAILADLEKHIEMLNEKNRFIASLFRSLEAESGGRETFYTGPGMVSHDLAMTLEKTGNEIKTVVVDIQRLVGEYQKNIEKEKR